MKLGITQLSLLVADYDQAIEFYCHKLGLPLAEDTALDNGKRWVVLGAPGTLRILLVKAQNTEQQALIGKQAADKVLLFLETDDFWTQYQTMQQNGIHFLEAPRDMPYATVVVFQDLYGNKWDLLQRK